MADSDIRLAVISDLHGNLTALEAVLADVRERSPDAIWVGGDLADGGASPAEVVDRVRSAGWPVVMGNTDEMLVKPETFEPVVKAAPQFRALWAAVREVADDARSRLGAERLAWLGALERERSEGGVMMVHATRASLWRAPSFDEDGAEAAFAEFGARTVVYGHTHRPGVRTFDGFTLVNAGSVSLSHDGDARASYALVDGGRVTIRRVEYDVEREIRLLKERRIPRFEWLAESLRSATVQMP